MNIRSQRDLEKKKKDKVAGKIDSMFTRKVIEAQYHQGHEPSV